MFAEDIDLMPAATVQSIYRDCIENGQSPYDLFGSLFRQMNDPKAAEASRFKGVRFQWWAFSRRLSRSNSTASSSTLIGKGKRGRRDQGLVDGQSCDSARLFQDSMDRAARHAFGAHFTHRGRHSAHRGSNHCSSMA